MLRTVLGWARIGTSVSQGTEGAVGPESECPAEDEV